MSSELESASPRSCRFALSPPQCSRANLGRAYICRESAREVLEFPKLGPNIDRVVLVQQDRQQRLCAAGVLNGLRSKEPALGSFLVENTIEWRLSWRLPNRIFEEKDHTVNWTVSRSAFPRLTVSLY